MKRSMEQIQEARRLQRDPERSAAIAEPVTEQPQPDGLLPRGWVPGMLLNVRNRGDAYVVTLYPDEHDPERPERSMTFQNPAQCQDFVSAWYSRQSANPLAR